MGGRSAGHVLLARLVFRRAHRNHDAWRFRDDSAVRRVGRRRGPLRYDGAVGRRMTSVEAAWDAVRGTAGGAAFGAALREYAVQREVALEKLADACALTGPAFEDAL